jgi:glycosyltransferase involved in cell wall biosynthesis
VGIQTLTDDDDTTKLQLNYFRIVHEQVENCTDFTALLYSRPMKKNIAIFCDYFLPGFRSGGLVRSVAAVIEALKNESCITIITRNHDLGVKSPYKNITSDVITEAEGCRVLYLSDKKKLSGIFNILKKESPDVIYFNSFFSPFFTLLPLFLIKYIIKSKSKIIIAPRGEFGAGSLKIKNLKKKLFLALKKWVIPENSFLHATSTGEKIDIQKIFDDQVRIILLNDIAIHQKERAIIHEKQKGNVKIIFISRITPIKNLDYALKIASNITGPAQFDIFGPIEDSSHWQDCKEQIARMPKNIAVTYRGELNHSDVIDRLCEYDLFLLPTQNENYGHAIVEALSIGCPVMISKNTPWQHLSDYQAGWDFELSDPALFSDKINELIPLDNLTYKTYQEGALNYFNQYINNENLVMQYKNYFIQTEAAHD